VWIRTQKDSFELTDNSGWSWFIKAKNEEEARDYSNSVEWEPWVNAVKNKEYIRSLIEADNELINKQREESNQNA
jgi:hypothetical protein